MELRARHDDHRALHHKHGIARLIRRLLTGIADAIWPPACPVCGGPLEGDAVVCDTCIRQDLLLDGARCVRCSSPRAPERTRCPGCASLPEGIAARIIAADYALARRWIIAFKYGRLHALGPMLADRLAQVVCAHPYARRAELVLPVPMHPGRVRDRGFNQAHVLAEAAADALGVPCRTDVLVRVRNTTQQVRLASAEERRQNMRGAFAVRTREVVAGKCVLVVDDVITTGATVGACAEALHSSGAQEVIAAAVAHPFHLFATAQPDLRECDI